MRLPWFSKDLEAVRNFLPLTDEQISELLVRTAKPAKTGDYEGFKTTSGFDSTALNPKWLGEPAEKS